MTVADVSVEVRDATSEDLSFLADANRAAQAAVVDARGGELDNALNGRRERIEDTFAADLGDDDVDVLVGAADGLAVGYAVIRRVGLASRRPLAELSDIWVHPDARGIGVGAALMMRALDRAEAWGCGAIDSRALPGDRLTKNFFESFGLVARLIHVSRPLP